MDSFSQYKSLPIYDFEDQRELYDRVRQNNFILAWHFNKDNEKNREYLAKLPDKSNIISRTLEAIEKDNNNELAIKNAKRLTIPAFSFMITGLCDADCFSCYTDRKYRPEFELTSRQMCDIFDQAKERGANWIYIAGEGEPLVDKRFFDILDYSRTNGLKVHVFTDGFSLSTDSSVKRFQKITKFGERYGIQTSEDFVRKIASYNDILWLQYKVWATDNHMLGRLVGRDDEIFEQITLPKSKRVVNLPRGLKRLLEVFSPDHLAIQTTPYKSNKEQVLKEIIPAIDELRLGGAYIEPHITPPSTTREQHKKIIKEEALSLGEAKEFSPYFHRKSCSDKVFTEAFVSYGKWLTSLLVTKPDVSEKENERQYFVLDEDGQVISDLFDKGYEKKFFLENMFGFVGKCACDLRARDFLKL